MGWDEVVEDEAPEVDISIHPPRVGWDLAYMMLHSGLQRFQSTHPVWGGTSYSLLLVVSVVFQSTHPVWGGTANPEKYQYNPVISIHPPRVGWDIPAA